jgi:hypothetical protein
MFSRVIIVRRGLVLLSMLALLSFFVRGRMVRWLVHRQHLKEHHSIIVLVACDMMGCCSTLAHFKTPPVLLSSRESTLVNGAHQTVLPVRAAPIVDSL